MTDYRTWDEIAAAYLAAKAVEDAHDHQFGWVDPDLPPGPERSAAVDSIPKGRWSHLEDLQKVRFELEDELLKRPSPHYAGFALKVLICRGEGRDLNGLDDMLEAEALRVLANAAFCSPMGRSEVSA